MLETTCAIWRSAIGGPQLVDRTLFAALLRRFESCEAHVDSYVYTANVAKFHQYICTTKYRRVFSDTARTRFSVLFRCLKLRAPFDGPQ